MKKFEEFGFNAVCDYLDSIGFTYTRDKANLLVRYDETGDDYSFYKFIYIENEGNILSQNIIVLENIDSEKSLKLLYVINYINSLVSLGKFLINPDNNDICYRVASFMVEESYSTDNLEFLISVTSSLVDDFNQLFVDINEGKIDVEEAIKEVDRIIG